MLTSFSHKSLPYKSGTNYKEIWWILACSLENLLAVHSETFPFFLYRNHLNTHSTIITQFVLGRIYSALKWKEQKTVRIINIIASASDEVLASFVKP